MSITHTGLTSFQSFHTPTFSISDDYKLYHFAQSSPLFTVLVLPITPQLQIVALAAMRDDLERERKTATLLRAIRLQRARSSAEFLHAQLAILRAANDGTAETVSIPRLDSEIVRRRIDELETEPREAEMVRRRLHNLVQELKRSRAISVSLSMYDHSCSRMARARTTRRHGWRHWPIYRIQIRGDHREIVLSYK